MTVLYVPGTQERPGLGGGGEERRKEATWEEGHHLRTVPRQPLPSEPPCQMTGLDS